MSDLYGTNNSKVFKYIPVGGAVSKVKTGLWQCNLDGSYIKVRRVNPDAVSYSEEGCMDVCFMPISELLSNYQLYESDQNRATDDIQWDIGTQGKSETILVTVCSKCGSTVPANSVGQSALNRWAARFVNVVKGMRVSK